MINLKSLMDLLPYYFKEKDTYKVNGNGLLERYLNIFGTYFDDNVISTVGNLKNLIDVDNTPEIYLGYLWEFLGSLPYANPKPVDPVKWKQYFNGFDDDSTIEYLGRIWFYSKDADGDHYNLPIDKIRSLIKYSVALFSIRGTKKFFEVLLKLYGFDVTITLGSTYPTGGMSDDDFHDFYGSDDDFYGSDDDFAGSITSIFDENSVITKLDSDDVILDGNTTLDIYNDCNRLVNVNFKLSSNYQYNVNTAEFSRLQDRMFNLINMFLPLGTRPHLIWDNVNIGDSVVSTVGRSLEVYIDRVPISWEIYDEYLTPSDSYLGWYKINPEAQVPSDLSFDWQLLRIMVKVNDSYTNSHSQGRPPAFIQDQPKKFVVAFDGIHYSDKEFDDGHVFTLNPTDNLILPSFKVSVLCVEDFNLSGIISLSGINWLKLFNYRLFRWFNQQTVNLQLSENHPYIAILIQSAFVRTYTNDTDPSDDEFIDQPVLNFTTGEMLTKCEIDTEIPDNEGNLVDYSAYSEEHMYVQHLFKPGTYEFVVFDKPEYKVTINVIRAEETISVSTDSTTEITIDNENPDGEFRVILDSDLHNLKSISTLPMAINESENSELWSTICTTEGTNSPQNPVGNVHNKPFYSLSSANLYYLNDGYREEPFTLRLAYLNKPIHSSSQYLRFVIVEHGNIDFPDDYNKITILINLITGRVSSEEEIRGHNIDGEPTFRYRYGKQITRQYIDELIPIENLIQVSESLHGIIDTNGSLEVKGNDYPISIREVSVPTGLSLLASHDYNEGNTLSIEFEGLYDDEIVIKETSNPQSLYWNNGELIVLSDPGHYRFYGENLYFGNIVSNYIDINVFSNKYNVSYFLLAEDSDKSDDEEYMIRTRIPDSVYGSSVNWSFDFSITLDKSPVEAMDILTNDPDAFDLEVLLYRGATPNAGMLLGSFTATEVVTYDGSGNSLSNYKVKGTINLTWDGTYNVSSENFPPGLYCIKLHDGRKLWPSSPSYRVIDGYAIPKKFKGNLYFDVDIISSAWTSPAGQVYDVDPITGKYTWGWYKTNVDQQYSVRIVRYDPSVDIPQFKLKLTNNVYGYTRVYLYKLVEDGSLWDNSLNSPYPQVLPPTIPNDVAGSASNPHWLGDAKPEDWGFPGGFNEGHWDYGHDGGINNYTARWLFTGSVYKIGDTITGPQEPGKYLFLVQQLDVDENSINYAYLEVKEEIKHSLIVNPSVVVLQGSAVSTLVSAVSSAKYTKEELYVSIINPDGKLVEEYFPLPYTFYAYQAGKYTFNLYSRESGGKFVSLGLSADFMVLTDSGIYPDTLSWSSEDISERVVQVATTSSVIDWTVEIPDE